MATVISSDGTRIGYSSTGSGRPLILVDGALCHRAFAPSADMAKALSEHFTVYTYDRRGRGESGDGAPGLHDAGREVDDLAAVIEAAGGSASLVGVSSGGVLALEAARRLDGVRAVVVYEAPLITDPADAMPADYEQRIRTYVAQDRRSEALRFFMRTVGMPPAMVHVMRLTPPWRKLKRVAHTLPNDAALVCPLVAGGELARDHWARVTAPVTVIDGGKSPESMRSANADLASALGATYRTLEGQTHMVKSKALAPAVVASLAPTPLAVSA